MSIIENIRNRSWVREKYEKEKDVVCALEEEWIARLLERLRQEEWQTQMIDHAETLWEVQAPCSAIMIQEEELTEAYRWRTKDAGDSICLQAFREFAEWQKVPIIVILQQRDDRLEEQLLRAGAAECVCRSSRLIWQPVV